jgi:hypothetical protein
MTARAARTHRGDHAIDEVVGTTVSSVTHGTRTLRAVTSLMQRLERSRRRRRQPHRVGDLAELEVREGGLDELHGADPVSCDATR